MKRRFFCCFAALVLALTTGPVRAESVQTAYENLDERIGEALSEVDDFSTGLVRLHVIAADDSAGAQALKLEVRDAVLEKAREVLDGCDCADDAFDRLSEALPELTQTAVGRARDQGWDGPIHAEMGVFEFPDREYGGVQIPAGEYRALRVIIGEGKGKNWWCVLFPTLCGVDDGPCESILARWLNEIFGGEGA